ncbi:MAG: molecular chaperone HtpG [Bacillota bacterium]
MSNNQTNNTREFQAEVKQLLDIVINSLYTDKKIFLRELISNAADALEKLRYTKIQNTDTYQPELPSEITIQTDDNAHTLTIADTGIGMTEEELVENLGTIAHSGSKAFLKHLTEGNQADVNLIGQFGVGFYSAFMVASKVTVYTRSYKPDADGCIWSSDGLGTYTIQKADLISRGTRIQLKLKEDCHEFAKPDNIKSIIKQYSSFVPFPIKLNGDKVNTIEALWTKNKNEISDENYNEFYKFIANAYDEPLFKIHFSVDAPININALLFFPKDHFERFGFGRMEPGVNLYCKKVLIQEKSEGILPEWLRFIKGVVDSEELPLNISRETMQDSALISKLRKVLTGRIVKFLAEQAQSNPDKYLEFWDKFQIFIKEGIATDMGRRKDLAPLLRFESSKSEPGKLVSLQEYLEGMKEGQDTIYYLNGPSRDFIENGPYLEIFKRKDIEVLYTYETADDYILNQLGDYEDKKLVSADQENIQLPETDDTDKTPDDALAESEVQELTKWMKEVLGDDVSEVRASKRLVDSPAILLSPDGMTNSMQRIMKLMNKDLNHFGARIMDINTSHPIIKKLDTLRKKADPFAEIAVKQLYDSTLISAGLSSDYKGMVNRMHEILDRALEYNQ